MSVKAKDQATISVKSHMSGDHVLAAAFFARSSGDIEAGVASDALRANHRFFAIGSITSAVAFLEAAVNEFYLAAIDSDPHVFGHADPRLPKLLAHVWEGVEEIATLQKYQVALILAQKMPFDRGTSPFQAARHLIVLRNNLIHYKPEWDSELKDHKRIEDRLSGLFAENPYSHPSQAFFPHRCLGHGCAAWAIKSAWAFVECFYNRMDLPYWAASYSIQVAAT